MITLFPDEKIVSQSNGDRVILTTHRICYENKEWGRSYNQSIMLEHITSCENHYNSNNWLLVLAGFFIIFGTYTSGSGNGDLLGLGIIIGVFLLIGYWLTRRNLIIIGSPSTKMMINVTGMKREYVLSFINYIEQTKHKRVLSIK